MKGYPKSFQSVLYGGLILMTISGLLLIPTLLDMRLEWDVSWRLDYDSRVIWAALHLLAGMVLIMKLGAIWAVHIRVNWRKKRNHFSGLILGLLLMLLGLTAAGLYYFGDEDLSLYNSLLHTLGGLSLIILILYHMTWGKKRAAQHGN